MLTIEANIYLDLTRCSYLTSLILITTLGFSTITPFYVRETEAWEIKHLAQGHRVLSDYVRMG